jgi:hypothetical protein
MIIVTISVDMSSASYCGERSSATLTHEPARDRDFLGDFNFNENGDPTLASGAVVGFTIFRGEEQLEVETSFSPEEEVVEAARTG